MSLEVAASNGVHSTISAPLAFVPVTLPVPLGRSLYTRLSQLADAEGLDLVTLAVQLLAYRPVCRLCAAPAPAMDSHRQDRAALRPSALTWRHAMRLCASCAAASASISSRRVVIIAVGSG